jgi:molybdenum cofactor synthesis domain-containing protein
MIALDDARALVFAAIRRLDPATLPIAEACGLVLATDVTSADNVPPFDNTAVDGYAVRAADTSDPPVELPVVGELAAGAAPSIAVEAGTAVRIMTGAPVPPGADAIVMVEDTERLDGGHRVRIQRAVQPGDAVRPAGDDVRAGDVVFRAGDVLNGASLGVLASINRNAVAVIPRARVAVLSTGDELVTDGSPLRPGQIRESNKTMLMPMLREAGCDVIDVGVIRDDEATLERALLDAARTCDAIVTSGGVSMGDYDVVKAVLSRIADMTWMQVAIRPAKPFAFGLLRCDGREVPVFGLPGNPVSSMVSFEVLARPALRRMMGHNPSRADRLRLTAIADAGLPRRPDEKTHLTRVYGEFGPDGRFHVRPTGPQGSHQLAATAQADGIAVVPDGTGIEPGGDVEVLLIRPS